MLTVTSVEKDTDSITTNYACNFTVTCDGTSIWGDTAGRKVHVTNIAVYKSDESNSITVTHDSTWDIYTDEGFAAAISAALGYSVDFTEQGMQDDEFASMELA